MASFDEGAWPDDLTDLAAGMRAIAEAEPDYVKANDYLSGDVDEFFASNRIARLVRKTGTSFRVNLARKAVTSVTDRLEIAAVTVPNNEAATKRLTEEVWDRNELTLEAPLIHEKACGLGDAYVFVWEGEEPGTVDVEYSGPMGTRAIYDPEHPRRISYVIKAWEVGVGDRKRQRVNLYYVDRIEKWTTEDGQNGTNPEHWSEYAEPGESWPIENPYGELPVFHFRTGRPYGRPLHEQAYGAQDAINKLIVSMMNSADFHLIPQRAALVDGPADGGEDDDDDFTDFGDDEDSQDGYTDAERRKRGTTAEDISKLKTGPGSLWLLRNVKSLVQLPPADPHVFLDPSEFFVRMMAQAVDMPLHMFDPGGDQPSGDSRRQSEGTLTKKVDRVEDSLEATWKKALKFALKVLGIVVDDVDVRFAPTAVIDDGDGWTTAAAKIAAGVPVRQVLIEAGYQSEQVADWLKDSSEQDLTRRVALLAQIAVIAKDLGTASTLGVIPTQVIEAVLAGIIGPGDDAETTAEDELAKIEKDASKPKPVPPPNPFGAPVPVPPVPVPPVPAA